MSVKYLTDAFLHRLREAVPKNAPSYVSQKRWIMDFSEGSKYCRETGIVVQSLPSLDASTGPAGDAENATRLYQALRSLTPVQATDERLWAFLTHETYWDYMVTRWGSTSAGVIADRFFLKGRGFGSLVRNGIARLWWSGYLTHDSARTDPFELTRVLFHSQDIQTGLLQRAVGKSPTIRMATLEYFKSNSHRIDALGWSKVVQCMMRDLNTAGGVYLLDALRTDQVQEILNGSLGLLQQ